MTFGVLGKVESRWSNFSWRWIFPNSSFKNGNCNKGWGLKHKWERPFRVVPISSFLNCFIRGVRLRLSWLVVFRSSSCLRILSIYFQPIAFGFCLLQHHLPAVPSVFLAVDLPERSVIGIQVGTSLAICTSAVRNIAGFSAFLFPGILHETYVSFLSALNSTF